MMSVFLRRTSPRVLPPDVAQPERLLIEGCRARDPAMMDALYRTYVARVERVIGRLLGPTPDVEDLVQQTFIEVIQSCARFRGEASLATWVTRIAVHVAHHQLRRGLRRTLPLELLPDSCEPRSPHPAVDDLAAQRQLAHRAHALLDRVSAKKRIAFLLYALEGYAIEEVAALMGASRAATKSRIWFARREVLKLASEDPMLASLIDNAAGQR